MELDVHHSDGSQTGRTVRLDDGVFGVAPHDHVLWLDVRRTQASARQGTHKTKERGEINGSTRKLYRQKGTGMARSGAISSPLRRGGGRTFGPRPRTYSLRLTRKTRRLARRSALSYKASAEALRIVEPLSFEEPDTAGLASVIGAFELTGQRVLLVTAECAPALYRSSRNLARIDVREARNLSAEDILRAAVLLCEETALAVFSRTLSLTDTGVPANEEA